MKTELRSPGQPFIAGRVETPPPEPPASRNPLSATQVVRRPPAIVRSRVPGSPLRPAAFAQVPVEAARIADPADLADSPHPLRPEGLAHRGHVDIESQMVEPSAEQPAPGARPTLANRAKKAVFGCMKAYVSFYAINTGIKIATHPGDVRPDPIQFFRAMSTGTDRADGLQVQTSGQAVLRDYGDFIPADTRCVDPAIRFEPALTVGGARIYGTYASDSGKNPGPGILTFDAYSLYLPKTAYHEFVHCYTHPDFYSAVRSEKLGDVTKTVLEGSTEYLTLKGSFSRRADPSYVFSGVYIEPVKFVKKIVDDVGETTLKEAVFSGNHRAIDKVIASALALAKDNRTV